MNPIIILVGLMLSAASVMAQVAPVGTAGKSITPQDIEGERSRIQLARAREEAAFTQAQAACYQKFAVNDCLSEIRKRRRVTLDGLRRQEVVLNDLQRKRKAQEQIEQIRQKSATQGPLAEPR